MKLQRNEVEAEETFLLKNLVLNLRWTGTKRTSVTRDVSISCSNGSFYFCLIFGVFGT